MQPLYRMAPRHPSVRCTPSRSLFRPVYTPWGPIRCAHASAAHAHACSSAHCWRRPGSSPLYAGRQIYRACEQRGRIAYKRSGGSRLITHNDHWKAQIRHALYTGERFVRYAVIPRLPVVQGAAWPTLLPIKHRSCTPLPSTSEERTRLHGYLCRASRRRLALCGQPVACTSARPQLSRMQGVMARRQ